MVIGSWMLEKFAYRLIGTLSLAILMGCSGQLDQAAVEQRAEFSQVTSKEDTQPQTGEVPQGEADRLETQRRPQLIRRVSLRLRLADLPAAVQQIEALLSQYQGDLLELTDQQPPFREPQQVSLKLRVPQGNLADMLTELRNLGTVQEQMITAEDVSTQLVDLDARIRNLRKSEEALLGIMERSGAVADVLEVARELSTVRETIERTDAQFKALKDQVAYSSIALTLVSSQTLTSTGEPVRSTLGSTWQTAGSALKGLSVGLLQLLIWLLVFSPYGAIALLALWMGRRYRSRRRQVEDA